MILYLDMMAGIAGDMFLGALVDLGVPVDWLKGKLSAVLDGFDLRTEVVFRSHLRAVNLYVDVTDHVTHRHYTNIREMIESADLPDEVRAKALTAFKHIAQAEARIHGKDIETVHFHEIGGIDSLVDIIGSFLALDYLGVDQVAATPVPLGSGTIKCAHGTIPVPVPATVAILKGLEVTGSDAKTEIVTPTGASIVATLAPQFGAMPDMKIEKVGYGAGKRDTGASVPNLLRLVLGSPVVAKNCGENILSDQVYVLYTNVDDMSPEGLGFVMDRLMDQGALDVSFTPAFMKKNRPATRIEVICRREMLQALSTVLLSETTSIGVRYHLCDRMILKRESVDVETSLGRVNAKKITDPNGQIRIMPEYDDCKRIALEKELPFYQVYDRILVESNPHDRQTNRL
ncbi:nickel pincer cofactor biosynthesis protein LarC [Desulfobacter hydrogenophilus]|uniref:Putative nickel insertion protein n=1 Tax=Desulfobacter hydrogenophilus TaxID=2291 RepID=A0A328FDC7_9BACT|nr:nickel pincer cofactor biosynthesis protein LarC [Desulfobacter hydrogenophilus]NDY71210.1 nickel pincer cofactor biosynthesis protein LarC [Desulfobacter hydrogenophilus]QBH15049.1 nickel pincer cofactor biosynthesis protein LarC [Desulfobacter hydrogenophilus]RAM02704.1 nickel pincer cofactor biosynthesis protein LarC [Desulfobacter hydrogenophilus]